MGCKGCGTKKSKTRTGQPSLDATSSPLNLSSVSTRPNPNLYPDGGYVFIEGDGTRFRGDSWKGLIAQVRAYRERNNKPVGDPEQDVFAQYCIRVPSHCKNMSAGVRTVTHHSMSLNQRVMQWFANLLDFKRRGPIARVTDAEAARRAEICSRCPRQKTLVQSCEQCLNTVRHGRKVVLDGAPSQHQNLLACEALGEDLPTTVHIEQPAVPEDRVPAECWRK